MEQPILNPPNPYVGTLRLFPGTLVKVSGRIPQNATRFAINFQTGPSLNPRDDLALHLSPCFGQMARIVRNSLINGNWATEESWGNLPLAPNQPFEIMILAEPIQFKVAVNGQHFCEYRHRIPFEAVTNLTIDGDVNIERIAITTISSNYSSGPPQPAAPPVVQPSPNTRNVPPYPSGPQIGMPMPPSYPVLPGGGPVTAPGPYPPMPSMPSIYPPQPSAAPGYVPAYNPQQPPVSGPHPSYPAGQMPPPGPGAYPQANSYGQPGPYQQGYQQPPQQQPGNSAGSSGSNSIFDALPINGKAMNVVKGLVKEGIYRKFPLSRHFL